MIKVYITTKVTLCIYIPSNCLAIFITGSVPFYRIGTRSVVTEVLFQNLLLVTIISLQSSTTVETCLSSVYNTHPTQNTPSITVIR